MNNHCGNCYHWQHTHYNLDYVPIGRCKLQERDDKYPVYKSSRHWCSGWSGKKSEGLRK